MTSLSSNVGGLNGRNHFYRLFDLPGAHLFLSAKSHIYYFSGQLDFFFSGRDSLYTRYILNDEISKTIEYFMDYDHLHSSCYRILVSVC